MVKNVQIQDLRDEKFLTKRNFFIFREILLKWSLSIIGLWNLSAAKRSMKVDELKNLKEDENLSDENLEGFNQYLSKGGGCTKEAAV